jgi:hypothetical protein
MMIKKKILEMKPGKDINASIGRYVMGHDVVADDLMGDMERYLDKEGNSVWGKLLPYSEDMATAQEVVVEMLRRGYSDAETWQDYGDGLYTPAEAICKRALIATLTSGE